LSDTDTYTSVTYQAVMMTAVAIPATNRTENAMARMYKASNPWLVTFPQDASKKHSSGGGITSLGHRIYNITR